MKINESYVIHLFEREKDGTTVFYKSSPVVSSIEDAVDFFSKSSSYSLKTVFENDVLAIADCYHDNDLRIGWFHKKMIIDLSKEDFPLHSAIRALNKVSRSDWDSRVYSPCVIISMSSANFVAKEVSFYEANHSEDIHKALKEYLQKNKPITLIK